MPLVVSTTTVLVDSNTGACDTTAVVDARLDVALVTCRVDMTLKLLWNASVASGIDAALCNICVVVEPEGGLLDVCTEVVPKIAAEVAIPTTSLMLLLVNDCAATTPTANWVWDAEVLEEVWLGERAVTTELSRAEVELLNRPPS